jgi:hypothetical protein
MRNSVSVIVSVKRSTVAVALAIVVPLAVGCSGDSDPAGPSGGSSLSADVQPIFTARCAAQECHGATEEQGLRLTSGASYNELVNVPSTEVVTLMRVLPSKPDSSYLIMKLGANPPQGLQMPRGLNPLSTADMTTIRDWIEDGALND